MVAAGRLPGEQPRQEEIGRGRLRVGAARRQPEDRVRAERRQPEHGTRVGGHAAPDEAPAEGVERLERRVRRIGAPRAGGEDEPRAGARRERRRRYRPGIVGDVLDRRRSSSRAPRPWPDARLEPLPRRRVDRFFTRTPTRVGRKRPTRTTGPVVRRDRLARSRDASSTRWGATLTLATRSPARTTWPSKPVKTSSGSIRSRRSRVRDPHPDDPVERRRRDRPGSRPVPASSAPDRRPPRRGGRRPRPRGRRPAPGRGPRSRRGVRSRRSDGSAARRARSSADSRRPFDQRSSPTRRSRGQDRPDEVRRRTAPRRRASRSPHPHRGQARTASAASTARRT